MVAKTLKEFPKREIRGFLLNRKGYFFVVDAIIAMTILLLGIFLLFGSSTRSSYQDQPLTTLEDFMTIASARSLGESTNSYYINTLLPARMVPVADMTPLEEVGYLYMKYNETSNITYMNYATNFTASLFNNSIDARFGAALSINGTVIYNRPIPQTQFGLSRTTVLYIRMNQTTLRGPVLSEVQLWY